jgi:hypothetical protein
MLLQIAKVRQEENHMKIQKQLLLSALAVAVVGGTASASNAQTVRESNLLKSRSKL